MYLRGSCTFSFCDKFIFISLFKVMGFNKCISDKVLTKKIYFSHENVNIKKIWNEPKTRKILNFLELIWIFLFINHVAPHFKHKYIQIKVSKVFNFNQSNLESISKPNKNLFCYTPMVLKSFEYFKNLSLWFSILYQSFKENCQKKN